MKSITTILLSAFAMVIILVGAVPVDKSKNSIKDDQCRLSTNDPTVGYADAYDLSSWAYAGVNVNPNYLCIYNASDFNVKILYKLSRANKVTDTAALNQNGCWFFPGSCTDPALRQQIIDANLCNWHPTGPQQIVDRFLITLNRPNWLYVTIAAGGDGWNTLNDDNFCYFTINNDQWNVLAAKIDFSA